MAPFRTKKMKSNLAKLAYQKRVEATKLAMRVNAAKLIQKSWRRRHMRRATHNFTLGLMVHEVREDGESSDLCECEYVLAAMYSALFDTCSDLRYTYPQTFKIVEHDMYRMLNSESWYEDESYLKLRSVFDVLERFRKRCNESYTTYADDLFQLKLKRDC